MMKKENRNIKNILKEEYKKNKRSSIIVYFVLRFLVILCMVLQILHGNIQNALLCLLSLVLLLVPAFIQRKYEIKLPNALEIMIYLFIFSAEILGEINNFYHIIPYWDTILHTLNGFLATAVGFSLIDLLNKNSKSIKLTPIYICIVAFCFSMTIGVCWEFFEYGGDKFLKTDMQKDTIIPIISTVSLDETNSNKPVKIYDIDHTIIYDRNNTKLAEIDGGYLDIGINDTMKDLFVNFIGAIVFCIFGYFYLSKNKKIKIVENLIPTREKRNY